MTFDPETKRFLLEFERFKSLDSRSPIIPPPGVTMEAADLPGPREEPKTLIDRGWVYRDISWRSAVEWDGMLAKIGPGEFKLLAVTGRMGNEPFTYQRRGQLLISPQGRLRAKL